MVTGDSGNVRLVRIEEEMRSAYLDYAMSVIVARALPDVRDGLKPVHRRILYAMQGMGLRPGASYKKSAAVVGEVLGKYHPHGDSPVYDALVRMAQDFSMRHVFVDGQGNFGSVDDDPPAAMRYTEARLASISEQLLQDIDRDTVDFVDNYDGSHREPTVLPSRLPALLVNGASGIAVGMATNVPPHNLREVCDALTHLIDHPEASAGDLIRFVHGPDFPTGATIMGREGIEQAYHTGHGRIVVRAKASIEEDERGGRQRIIVSQIPYQVNKASLVEKIAMLAKDKKIDGISEVRDESDREGMRVVVELARNAAARVALNNLYQHTAMQSAFHVNMVALVDGQPRVLSLRSALQHFIEFRRDVVRRRAEYDLARARERAHILEGLRVALENLDAVIALIRGSADVESARGGLTREFGLTEAQAQAILEMQLRRLAALERERIENEYQELMRKIADLEGLLADPGRVLRVIKEETAELRKGFGEGRRTEILDQEARDQSQEELTPHADVVFTLSDRGYIKRLPIALYRLQRRGGKGVRGQETREGDAVQQLIVADTHDYLLFFTDKGRVYRKRVFEMGQDSSRNSRGTPVQNLIEAINPAEEVVTAVVAISRGDLGADRWIFMATRKGEVKKMHLSHFQNIRSNGLAAFDLEADDSLLTARLADEGASAVLVTRNGKGVRFGLEKVTERQTRGSGGVRGIRLMEGDEVVAMDVAPREQRLCPAHYAQWRRENPGEAHRGVVHVPEGERTEGCTVEGCAERAEHILGSGQLMILSTRGNGKRTAVGQFRETGRGVQGVIAMKITERTGPIAAAVVTGPGVEEIMVGSRKAMVYRTKIMEIRSLGRNTQGVQVMTKLSADDEVISMSAFRERSAAEFEELPEAGMGASPARNGAEPSSRAGGRSPRSPQLAMEFLDGAGEGEGGSGYEDGGAGEGDGGSGYEDGGAAEGEGGSGYEDGGVAEGDGGEGDEPQAGGGEDDGGESLSEDAGE